MADEKDKKVTTTTKTTPGTTTTTTHTVEKPEVTNSQHSESHVDLSPDAQARLQQEQAQLAKSYGLNADGTPDPNVPLLGYDENKYREEQEAKARIEQFKQKEAGWRNALSVVADIITAGFGGNVYAREKDNVAADAQKKQDEIRTNLRGMETAAQQARLKRQQDYQKDKAALEQRYVNTYGTRKTDATNTQGKYKYTTTNTSTKPASTTTTVTNKPTSAGKAFNMIVTNQDGTYSMREVDKSQALAYARQTVNSAIARYNDLSSKDTLTSEEESEKKLIEEVLANARIDFNNDDGLKDNDYINYLTGGRMLVVNKNGNILEAVLNDGSYVIPKTGETGRREVSITMPGIEVEQKGDSVINTMPGVQ